MGGAGALLADFGTQRSCTDGTKHTIPLPPVGKEEEGWCVAWEWTPRRVVVHTLRGGRAGGSVISDMLGRRLSGFYLHPIAEKTRSSVVTQSITRLST